MVIVYQARVSTSDKCRTSARAVRRRLFSIARRTVRNFGIFAGTQHKRAYTSISLTLEASELPILAVRATSIPSGFPGPSQRQYLEMVRLCMNYLLFWYSFPLWL